MTATVELELCWGTVDHLDVIDQIRAAAAAGFRCVTMSPSKYQRLLSAHPGGATAVRRTLADEGVTVTVLDCLMSGLPGSPDASAAPPQYAEMFAVTAEQCFVMLDELGGETLQIAHFLGSPVTVEEMADAIGALAEQARARGRRIVLEFMPGTGIPDLPTATAIVTAVGAPNVSVMFDTWHFARTGGDLPELEELTPGLIGGLQVNDCPIPAAEMAALGYVPMSDRLVPGDGVFPLGDVLRTIFDRSGVTRVGIEVFSSQLRALPGEDAAARVRDATASVLSDIGCAVT